MQRFPFAPKSTALTTAVLVGVGLGVGGCGSGSGAGPEPRVRAGSAVDSAAGSQRVAADSSASFAGARPPLADGSSGPPGSARTRESETNDSPEVPFALGESWSGTYLCAQGLTALKLKIDSTGPQVEALFDFDVPDGTSGSFTVSGSYDTTTRHLHLIAGDWLRQPSGYVTVDLDGSVSLDGHVYSGSVLGPGCKSFQVQKP